MCCWCLLQRSISMAVSMSKCCARVLIYIHVAMMLAQAFIIAWQDSPTGWDDWLEGDTSWPTPSDLKSGSIYFVEQGPLLFDSLQGSASSPQAWKRVRKDEWENSKIMVMSPYSVTNTITNAYLFQTFPILGKHISSFATKLWPGRSIPLSIVNHATGHRAEYMCLKKPKMQVKRSYEMLCALLLRITRAISGAW